MSNANIQPKPGPRRQGVVRVNALITLLLVASLAAFIVRGPMFALPRGVDFILIYSPARTLLMGGNPYQPAELDQVWLAAGGPNDDRVPSKREDGALIYPLTTLAMFAPFAAMTWKYAQPAWVIANVGFLAIVLGAIAALANFKWRQRRTWVFFALALLFMPVHTTFRVGQTPLFVLAFIMSAYVIEHRQQRELEMSSGAVSWRGHGMSVLSGLLLAASALIKPQIGLPFAAFEVLRRRWGVVAAAIITIVAVSAIAVIPISMRGVPWWSNWQTNLANFTNGNVGDPTANNPWRYQLLNLHYPLHTLVEDRTLVNTMVLAVVGGLSVIFFRPWIVEFLSWMTGRGLKDSATSGTRASASRQVPLPGDDRDPAIANRKAAIQCDFLLPLSMIAILTLMIVYHRYYDAVLLLLPMAAAIRALSFNRRDGVAWSMLLFMVPIFFNMATTLAMFQDKAALPAWLLHQWWWNGIVMPLQAWSLPVIAILLIGAAKRYRRQMQWETQSHEFRELVQRRMTPVQVSPKL